MWNRPLTLARIRGSMRSPSTRLAIGLVTTLALGFVFATRLKVDALDLKRFLTADGVTFLSALLAGERRDAVPVTIVDIDERAFLAWGSPAAIPRDRLAALLERLLEKRPRAVVVDVDLSLDSQADAAPMRALVEGYSRLHAAPPLLLVRHLREMPSGTDVGGGMLDRDTPLDDVVQASPNVRWVVARFKAEDDWFFRRWSGFQTVCATGIPRAFPAVALATTAVSANPTDGISTLDAWLRRRATAACAGEIGSVLPRADDPPWLRNAGETMTIPFAVGFTQDVAQFGTTPHRGRITPIFARLPAAAVLDGGGAPGIEDRVVVIGASYEEARDLHRTPLGVMPGVYVLANLVALGGGPLAEERLGGGKPFLLGAGFLAAHLLAGLLLRQPFSTVALVLVVAASGLVAVYHGVPPYVVYEGSVAGILLIGLYATVASILEAVAQTDRGRPRHSWIARFLLSDWALGRRRSRP